LIVLALKRRARGAGSEAEARTRALVTYPGSGDAATVLRRVYKTGRTISPDDALLSIMLLHLWRIAETKRRETWPAEARSFSRDLHESAGHLLGSFTSLIPPSLEQLSGLSLRDLRISLFAAFALEKLEVVAAARGYRLDNLRLEGGERLQEALRQGHGAVLWVENSFSASLLAKAAVAQAGFAVHHLSRPGHNLSTTRYGMRVLNPIVRKAEDRFLAERILVDDSNELAVARHIMELLRDNQVVSVTVSSAGSQTVEAPALNGVIRIATGAPHFALRSGAPLLPVLSYRDGEEYVVEIGEPIVLAGMKREDAYAFAVREYARRVDAFARAHPLDWCGWRGGTYFEGEAAAVTTSGEATSL
jgi:lauroyl/myristoyl acyltransferase